MRERCNELCTKPTKGTCNLCDVLDEGDRWMRIVKRCILIGIVVVLIIFGFMKVLEEGKMSDIIQAITAIILFITAYIVWKYTEETKRLREEAQRQVEVSQKQVEATKEQTKISQDQIEINQRPFVIVQCVDLNKIWLRNIGTSPAFNTKVWGARVRYMSVMSEEPDFIWESLRSYGSISYMGHTFGKPTDIEIRIFNVGLEGRGIQEVDLRSGNYFLAFKIVYDNVNIQTHYTEQGIKPITQTSIDLEIFSSGKLGDRTDEDLIWISTSEDGMQNGIYLTPTGSKKLREMSLSS